MATSSCWTEKPSVEGLRENWTEEGTPYMRWELTWTGGLLRAEERRDCGQALEGFELLRGALFSLWQGLVIVLKVAPHMGCMMPSVEGLAPPMRWEFTWIGGHEMRGSRGHGKRTDGSCGRACCCRTEEGTPYAVGVHVDGGLLGAGERRDCSGQHGGCMMPSVEGLREN